MSSVPSIDSIAPNDRDRGLTLVEIVVVLAIVAVVAAIVAPLTSRAMLEAKKAGCLANLKSIGTGPELYMADFDGLYPKNCW